ncbi:MAG: zinc ribbon domain-containing protein [Methanobacteriota archaeon]|nr:MAG: zinc ribbon domain-containing protein [Euryarchaeota archaeon]
MKCPKCGNENPERKFYCGWCNSRLRVIPPTRDGTFRRQESSLPIAGILLILAGLFAFIQAMIFLEREIPSPYLLYEIDYWWWTESNLLVCGYLDILLGAIITLGGVLTVRRANYSFSMIAAILAILSVGGGMSIVYGTLALLIVYRSRGDFENKLSLRALILGTISRMKR